MPTQTKTPGTFASVSRSTTDEQAWGDNVTDVQTEDTDYLICIPWVQDPPSPSLATSTIATESNYAVLTNFAFDIPSNAIDIAITARIKKGIQNHADDGGIVDVAVYLYLSGVIGSNVASAAAWTYPHATTTYTGFGITPTYAQLSSSGFGIAIAIEGTGSPILPPPYIDEGPAQAEMDLVQLVISYNLDVDVPVPGPDYEPPVFPPDTENPPEPDDSPYSDYPPYIIKAAKPTSLQDAYRGRICTKTKMWVPGHRLKWVEGKPYLDTVAVEPGENMPNPIVNTPSS